MTPGPHPLALLFSQFQEILATEADEVDGDGPEDPHTVTEPVLAGGGKGRPLYLCPAHRNSVALRAAGRWRCPGGPLPKYSGRVARNPRPAQELLNAHRQMFVPNR